ncbi:hypothetical protein [Streptomyces swartbergensis]|uniref:hypothetical protein n=1 Tax=Streptomyces swartbergensis TaxID=487165 RepID=UPI00380F8DDC
MRRIRGLAAVAGELAAALALVFTGAPSAAAKGQAVVLLDSPTTWQTAALYSDDARYRRLESLLGHSNSNLDRVREQPPKLGNSIGRQIDITWMTHDAWRVDRVYPAVPGTRSVWILTEFDLTGPTNNYTWHKAEHPEELRALLTKVGRLMGKEPNGSYPDLGVTQPSDEEFAAAPEGTGQPPAQTTAAPTHEGTDWWWAIPGLAAGAVLALVLRPFVARLPRSLPVNRWRVRRAGTRQELGDL